MEDGSLSRVGKSLSGGTTKIQRTLLPSEFSELLGFTCPARVELDVPDVAEGRVSGVDKRSALPAHRLGRRDR